MADLSSLLNPAPSSERRTPETTQEAHIPDRDPSYGGSKRPNLPPVKVGAPDSQPSIKSPLDTLADAATSSAPLLSPTIPNSTYFMSLAAYPQSSGHPSSRPSSSHVTPPRPYDQAYAPAPTSPTFSPGLQQYHHPTSSEVKARRASETAETLLGPLPPLRGPFLNSNHPETNGQSAIHSYQEAGALSILPGIEAAASLVPDHSTADQPEPTTVTPQSRQPSPGPSIPAQDSNPSPKQADQVEVKTELISDIIPNINPTSIPQSPPVPDQSSEPKEEIDSSTPTAEMKMKMKSKASPALSNASAPNGLFKPQPASSRKRPAAKKGTATAVKPAAKKRKLNKPTESIEKSSPLARPATPSSNRASKTPTTKNRKRQSATPQRSPSFANDDDDDDEEEEDGVFCICRGPDNHTWMIACDGPCEDWFHGRCINMTEKEGELIEKYYCKTFARLLSTATRLT